MDHFLHTGKLNEDSEAGQVLPPGLFNDDTAPTLLVPGRGSGLGEMGVRRALGERVDTEHFVRVPAQKRSAAQIPCWRVEISIDHPTAPMLRLIVIDSAVLGRGHTADINLDGFDEANHFGISRQHAMLRPAQRALFFFDLGSTNGSHHNGVLVGSNAASLAMGDVIRLGRLTMTVRQIERIG